MTPRFKMTDINSNVITLCDSSLAREAAVRIYVEDMHGAEAVEWVDGQGWRPMPVPKATGAFGKHAFTPGGIGIGMHLNREQARALGEALLAFANEKESTLSIHPSILEAHAAQEAARARARQEARLNAYGSGASKEALATERAAEEAFKAAVQAHAPARELELIEAGQGTCCCCSESPAEEVWFQFAQEEGT